MMPLAKTTLLPLAIAVALSAIAATAAEAAAGAPKFATTSVDVGTLKPRAPANANIGTEPLVIVTANTSNGGCTASYTKAPVVPGKGGSVSLSCLDLPAGAFKRSATVAFAGVEQQTVLEMTGQVSR